MSNLNKKIYAKIEAWRKRPIEGEHPYLYLDGIVMSELGRRGPQCLAAGGLSRQLRGISGDFLGICEGAKEDKSGWSAFLRHLVERGLKGVQLIISDACRGLIESIGDYLPRLDGNAAWCIFTETSSATCPPPGFATSVTCSRQSMPRKVAKRLIGRPAWSLTICAQPALPLTGKPCRDTAPEPAQILTLPDGRPSWRENLRRVERSNLRLPVVIDTSENGVLRRPVEPTQYNSKQFQRLMADSGIVCSMSRSGNVWDNAAMEKAGHPH